MNGIRKATSSIWYTALIVFALLLLLPTGAIAQSQSQNKDGDGDDALVVNVWAASPADSGEGTGPALSKAFIVAGLNTMSALRSWQSHLTYMIRNGYPLAEQWIVEDRGSASDRLLLAAQAASTTADRAALSDLNNQYQNLAEWSDQMVEAKRRLELAQFYMSPAGLDGDVLFQKTVECANFLAPMLASGRLRQSSSCQ
jgi:hypothetical protein